MKRSLVSSSAMFLVLLFGGCSSSKTVGVLSQNWSIGQHQDCVYAHQGIYCLPPRSGNLGAPTSSTQFDPKLAEDTLFEEGVDIVHVMEKHRADAQKDSSVDVGTYETRFSTNPADYSTWDCYKTGSGAPAIQCKLVRKPDEKSRGEIAKREREARVDDLLASLTPESLISRCGKPGKMKDDSISKTLFYSPASGRPFEFRFSTYRPRGPALEWVESELTPAEKASKTSSPQHVFWSDEADFGRLSEAGTIAEHLSCLQEK